MSKVIKLKKGLDIKLKGEAEKVVKAGGKCTLYAMKPTDFRALTPKLTVKVGDVVKAGDALFTDKANPGIKFTAPVSGCIEAINRGERRKLLEVVIKADSEITYRDFGKADVKPTQSGRDHHPPAGQWHMAIDHTTSLRYFSQSGNYSQSSLYLHIRHRSFSPRL